MDFSPATFGLAFAAGGLSTLSPCVLPLVPILLGTAVTAHRHGPLALAGGLALSFTVVGVLIASVGVALGLDQTVLRQAGAILLMALGILLLSSRLQAWFAGVTSGVSGVGGNLLSRVTVEGLWGQFIIGLLLGLVWSPCVGPTLGAAITLASQGRSLEQVTLLMAVFGVGAALPLIVLGLLSRQALTRFRGRLLAAGKLGKALLGAVVLLIGTAILSGVDKAFEAWVLGHSPEWLLRLTTSI